MTSNQPLNERDCLVVLKSKLQHERFKLLNYEVESFGDKNGFMSNQYRLRCMILNKSNGKIEKYRFFMKVKPVVKDDPIAQLMSNVPVYVREISMYKLINDEINGYLKRKWCPTLYGTFNESVIVLEDLSEFGYQAALPPLLYWDLEHCHAALDVLAALHSASLYLAQKYTTNMQQIKSILKEKYPTLLSDIKLFDDREELGQNYFESIFKGIFFLLDECLESTKIPRNELKEFIKKRHMSTMDRLMSTSDRYLNVINHGDVWGNNMLFKYLAGQQQQIESMCLFDFQVVHYSPPMVDVVKFIMINTTVEFQHMHMEKLLDYYYNKLTMEVNKLNIDLAAIFSADEFHTACAEIMIDCKLLAFEYKSILYLPNIQRLAADSKFMFGDRSRYIKDVFDSEAGNTYRQHITPLVQDLHDTIVKYTKLT